MTIFCPVGSGSGGSGPPAGTDFSARNVLIVGAAFFQVFVLKKARTQFAASNTPLDQA